MHAACVLVKRCRLCPFHPAIDNVTSNPSVQFEYEQCDGGYYSGEQGGGGGGSSSGSSSGDDDPPPPEPEVCGNGKCLYPETCGNCADDCGPCQTVGVGDVTRQCINENDWALTFDDGPSDVTDDLLDILRAKEAKASFFVVGNRISWSAAQFLQRAQSQGHYIARCVRACAHGQRCSGVRRARKLCVG